MLIQPLEDRNLFLPVVWIANFLERNRLPGAGAVEYL